MPTKSHAKRFMPISKIKRHAQNAGSTKLPNLKSAKEPPKRLRQVQDYALNNHRNTSAKKSST